MSRPPQRVAAKTAKWWKCCSASLYLRFTNVLDVRWPLSDERVVSRRGPPDPLCAKEAAFFSSFSQQPFATVFLGSLSQQPVSAVFLSSFSRPSRMSYEHVPERTLHSSAFLPWPQPLPKACQHFPGQTMLIGKRGWKYARRGNTQGAAIAPLWKIGEAKLMWT